MYDISDEESFANLTYRIKELKENINNKVLIYLIGNKSEMQEKRAIT
jgi:GTPase SAR1 family protein